MRMRYSVYHKRRMRTEMFMNGQFADALSLAEQLGRTAYVMDWRSFEKVYPPKDRAGRSLAIAVGTSR